MPILHPHAATKWPWHMIPPADCIALSPFVLPVLQVRLYSECTRAGITFLSIAHRWGAVELKWDATRQSYLPCLTQILHPGGVRQTDADVTSCGLLSLRWPQKRQSLRSFTPLLPGPPSSASTRWSCTSTQTCTRQARAGGRRCCSRPTAAAPPRGAVPHPQGPPRVRAALEMAALALRCQHQAAWGAAP